MYSVTLEEFRNMVKGFTTFETSKEQGTVVHVRKAIIPNRTTADYFEYHFNDQGILQYFF